MRHTCAVHRWNRRIVALIVVAATASLPAHGEASAGDTVRLIDVTGTIALRVPSDWRDSDT